MEENLDLVICPACGKEMESIFVGGTYLDVCTQGCGGIYFDNKEYKMFDEQHENMDELIAVLSGKEFKKVDESEIRICPICQNNMVKHFSSSLHTIQIDHCYHCGGIFLDNNELVKIREEFETEQQRGNAALDELKSHVGEELYERSVDHKSIKQHFLKKMYFGIIHDISLHSKAPKTQDY